MAKSVSFSNQVSKYPSNLYDAVTPRSAAQQENLNLKYQSCQDAVYDLSSPTTGRSILKISPYKLDPREVKDSREPLQQVS